MRKILVILLVISAIYASGQSGRDVLLADVWADTNLVPSAAHLNTYNEVWSYAYNGREYGIIGSTFGTHIIDVTDPGDVYEVVRIAGAAQGAGVIHRHFDDYAGYLYMVCDEGASTLQIADLSYLPDSAPLVYNSNALFTLSHNIYIDKTKGKLYTAGGYPNPGIRVFSLANPESPVEVASMQFPETTHDVHVRNDTAYVNDGTHGFYIVNFGVDPPVLLGTLTSYPEQGYNHSGWLSADGKIYALADETHGKPIKFLDVSDPSDIQVLSMIGSNVYPQSIPHNIVIKDSYAYVSYYFDGLYVFDFSNPAAPFAVGSYDTSSEIPNQNYRGAWGVTPLLPSGTILVSDMQNGLFVFHPLPLSIGQKVEEEAQLRIWPNPFDSGLTIDHPGGDYQIRDLSGKLIQQGYLAQGESELDISASLAAGVYTLTLVSAHGAQTLRLIKK